MIKIRFSIAVWSEIYDVANAACMILNDYVNNTDLSGKFYGPIDEVIFVAVSVSDEIDENNKFVSQHNGRGVLTDFSTGKKRRFVSIGVPMHPNDVLDCEINDFSILFIKYSREFLVYKKKMFLKGVDFDALYRDYSVVENEFVSFLRNGIR